MTVNRVRQIADKLLHFHHVFPNCAGLMGEQVELIGEIILKELGDTMNWHDINEVQPDKEELVLCVGERGGYFLGYYRKGNMFNVPNYRQGVRDAVAWASFDRYEQPKDHSQAPAPSQAVEQPARRVAAMS